MASLAQIERAASEQNRWMAIGIVIIGPRGQDSGTLAHGVIAFNRELGDESISYGTAEFAIEAERIGFHWGHYDLTRTEALEDLTKRLEARV